MKFENTIRLVAKGLDEDIFPCAAYAIGNRTEVFVKNFVGYRSLYPDKARITENTLFDLASLSKIVSTTMLTLKAIEQGRLCLDDKLEQFFEHTYDKGEITIQNLMTHTSGLAPHLPLYLLNITPAMVFDKILEAPFGSRTNREAVYSCLGYILLGKILEDVYAAPLDELAHKLVFAPLGMNDTTYHPKEKRNMPIAATEYSNDLKRYICGIPNDENCRFLGGVSGNSGVFSNLQDMVKFCTMLSNWGSGYLSLSMFGAAVRNYTHGFSENRGLGFLLSGDRPSFAGDLFSVGSYGHTGFTGTSMLVDRETGLYAILLTNRLHFGRENDGIIRFRRLFHNSIMGAL